MDSKIVKEYLYKGFGYPILLKNVKFVKCGNVWCYKIDLRKLQKKELKNFNKINVITGNHLKFIRISFRLAVDDMACFLLKSEKKIKEMESKHTKALDEDDQVLIKEFVKFAIKSNMEALFVG